jgi:hypothetical protein
MRRQFTVCKSVSKILRTDAVKIIKLTIRPISHHHPWSSSLPHVDTDPTISSIFGTLPGRPFLWECQAVSVVRPGSPQWHRFCCYFIFGNRKKSQSVKAVEYHGWGMTAICLPPETAGWGWKCETGCCHGEAARSVLTNVQGNVFARFHAVTAKDV